jgi:uncharacterized protein
MSNTSRSIPAPAVTPETAAYWEAAAKGTLLVRVCRACGQCHHYPRTICPFCYSDRTEWKEACGRGVIYSYSVMRRAPQPYAIAYVTLEEGPTMMTNIVDCDFDALAIGDRVRLVMQPSDNGQPVPMFVPAAALRPD